MRIPKRRLRGHGAGPCVAAEGLESRLLMARSMPAQPAESLTVAGMGKYQINRPVGIVVDTPAFSSFVAESATAYEIEIVFGGGLTPSQQAIFTDAANRWQEILTGDIPDVGSGAWGAAVDDVRIEASGVAIDGSGGVLGQAGPEYFRSTTFLPIKGIMQFDTADLANLESSGQLDEVILHEMAHVMGLGTIWGPTRKNLLSGGGTSNPTFIGTRATAESNAALKASASGVPVENTGGSGTRDSHWRESTFNNELMTGFLNGGVNPISRITAAQWIDLGYPLVNVDAADQYVLPGGNVLPTVGTLTDSPDPVSSSGTLTLNLSSATDSDGIANVKFYREANGIPGLQTELGDVLVGTDTTGPYSVTIPTTGLDGTYTYYARATDIWGAVSSTASTTNTVIPDSTAPTIVSVSSSVPDGAYKAGTIIPILVTFSEPVAVTGTPTLTLETGAGDAVVNYSSGSGTNVLTFNYTVAAGQNSLDLDYVSAAALNLPVGPQSLTVSNNSSITIPTSGNALPYPSNISVSTLFGTITNVTAALNGITHTRPDDIDVLLVGPDGQSVVLMSDVGGTPDISNINLSFSDAAASSLPDSTVLTSGTYKPTNINTGDSFPSAPAGAPSGTTLAIFNGGSANGTWSLYVRDDQVVSNGSISGGWSLTISTTGDCAIRDLANNDAVLTLPTPGATGSLAANKNIVVDTIAPTAFGGEYDYAHGKIVAQFSENVSASLAAADLLITPVPSGAGFSPSSVIYEAGNLARFSFSTIPADGNYAGAFVTAGITDAAGNELNDDGAFSFFVFAGDANHDRFVNVLDMYILSQNWFGTGKTFDQGDFNYDTVVDSTDLGIVGTRWLTTLQSPPPPPPPAPMETSSLSTTTTSLVRQPARKSSRLIDQLAINDPAKAADYK